MSFLYSDPNTEYMQALADLKRLQWKFLAEATISIRTIWLLESAGSDLGEVRDISDVDKEQIRRAIWAYRWGDTVKSMAFPNKGIYILYCNEWDSTLPISLFPNRYKIGISDDIPTRFRQLRCGAGYPLVPIHVIKSGSLSWIEAWIHRLFERVRIKDDATGDEWFELNPAVIFELWKYRDISRPKTVSEQRELLDIQINLVDALALNNGPLFES
jgi:hypothetical protein